MREVAGNYVGPYGSIALTGAAVWHSAKGASPVVHHSRHTVDDLNPALPIIIMEYAIIPIV